MTDAYVPARQPVHIAEVDAATVEAYAPTAHAVHAFVPAVSVLYVPVAHAVHQREVGAATSPEYEPAAQPVHAAGVAAATTSPYLPATHAVHALVPPTGPL